MDYDLQKIWETRRGRWQSKYPWLELRDSGLGCSSCFANGSRESMWSKFEVARPFGFADHQSSAEHSGKHRVLAPEIVEFKDAMRAIRKGQTETHDAGRHKLRRMKFCLGEAIRRSNIHSLKRSETIALFQDVRAGRLAVRFSCASNDLQYARGCFGQAKVQDASAVGLRDTTVFIFTRACTPYLPPQLPEGFELPASYGKLDNDALNHICSHCHMFNSDAAGDETLTGKLLQGSRDDGMGCAEHPFLPNVSVRSFDKAHASRRVVSSTFGLDPYLNEVVQAVVVGPGAIAKRIQYSPTFKFVYADFVQAMDSPFVRTRIKDMQSAPHRFESHSKPLARAVLWFWALVSTAQVMFETRAPSTDYHKSARNFLKLASNELVVTLGLLADAAAENLALVRVFDVEAFDKTTVRQALDTFLAKVTFLFMDPHRGCLETTSFTSFALNLLRERNVTIVVDNDAHSLGGEVGGAILDRCFARMQAWVQMARATLKAEFPSFEIMGTFEMFALSHDVSVELMREHVKRLSRFLSLPSRALQQQIDELRPVAMKLLEELCAENVYHDQDLVSEAWRGAILLRENEARDPRHARASTAEIRAALIRCMAWVFSTSGVERLFSRQAVTSRMSRAELSEDLIDHEMLCLMAESLPGADEAIFAAARQIWQEFYGIPRKGCRERKDKGRQLGPRSGFTESAWLRQRHADIAAASYSARASLGNVSEPELGQGSWHASHDAYMDFTSSKREKLFLSAWRWAQRCLVKSQPMFSIGRLTMTGCNSRQSAGTFKIASGNVRDPQPQLHHSSLATKSCGWMVAFRNRRLAVQTVLGS